MEIWNLVKRFRNGSLITYKFYVDHNRQVLHGAATLSLFGIEVQANKGSPRDIPRVILRLHTKALAAVNIGSRVR